jgi:hypothetical protein
MSAIVRRSVLAPLLAAVALLLALAGRAPAAEPARAVASPAAPAASAAVSQFLSAVAVDAADLQRGTRQRTPPAKPAKLTEAEATSIARGSGRLQDWIGGHPITRTAATFDKSTRRWTVWFVHKDAKTGKETTEAQVFVDDGAGEIVEVRTGPQVAWMMARGYEGAFGRHITRPIIWSSLCVLFLVPLLNLRRLISWRTLDLLALLSFSLSLIWFNDGEIFTSVPLAYPPLVYLAARLVVIGMGRRRPPAPAAPEGAEAPAQPPVEARRPALLGWCPTWLMVTCLVLCLALRYGLNAFDSNVIDVGYAGVIGADRIEHGITPYGTFPSDCARCDTYGPLVYLSVTPFEAASPWKGTWDDLPAAHGAATLYDLLCVAGMLVLGWTLAGWRLGVGLSLAWAAFPFTAYSLESNSNDSLVAACLIWGLVLARRPLGRGLMLGLACATKFAPLVLIPLWSRHPFPRAAGGVRRRALLYVAGLALAVVGTGWVLLLDGLDGVRAFWSRTIGYQLDRDSPFSIWGQYPGLHPAQIALTAVVLVAGLVVWRWPRRLDLLGMVALSGALIIGIQLTLTHWFYLYLPWFLPFALLAMVPEWPRAVRRPSAPETTPEAERVMVPA